MAGGIVFWVDTVFLLMFLSSVFAFKIFFISLLSGSYYRHSGLIIRR